jgi:hypothetical protein
VLNNNEIRSTVKTCFDEIDILHWRPYFSHCYFLELTADLCNLFRDICFLNYRNLTLSRFRETHHFDFVGSSEGFLFFGYRVSIFTRRRPVMEKLWGKPNMNEISLTVQTLARHEYMHTHRRYSKKKKHLFIFIGAQNLRTNQDLEVYFLFLGPISFSYINT